jgi:uncharacterized membrane protein
VPALPVIAVLGIAINIYLIINLSKEAQMYSLGWLVSVSSFISCTVKEIQNFRMEDLERRSKQNKNLWRMLILISTTNIKI